MLPNILLFAIQSHIYIRTPLAAQRLDAVQHMLCISYQTIAFLRRSLFTNDLTTSMLHCQTNISTISICRPPKKQLSLLQPLDSQINICVLVPPMFISLSQYYCVHICAARKVQSQRHSSTFNCKGKNFQPTSVATLKNCRRSMAATGSKPAAN